MAADPIHLSKWCCYDEDEMWCGEMPFGNQTRDLNKATCFVCLRAAADYGHAGYMREAQLLGLDPLNADEALRRVVAILGAMPFGKGEPGCWHVDDPTKAFSMLAGGLLDGEVSLKIMGDTLCTRCPDAIAFARRLLEAVIEAEAPP